MNRLLATLLLSVATILTVTPASKSATCEQAIQAKVAAMYDLDTNWYRVEVLSHSLKSAEVNPQHLTLRPLSQGCFR